MRHAVFVVSALLALVVSSLPVGAQEPAGLHILEIEVTSDIAVLEVPTGGRSFFTFEIHDRSRDGPAGFGQEGTPGLEYHAGRVVVTAEKGDSSGWIIGSTSPPYTRSGESREISIPILASNRVVDPFILFNVTVTYQHHGETQSRSLLFTAMTPGVSAFSALPIGGIDPMKPRETRDVEIKIANQGLVPRDFSFAVLSNVCGLDVLLPPGATVAAKDSDTFHVSIGAPYDKMWYFSEDCPVLLQVEPEGELTGTPVAVPLSVQISGGYLDPQWAIWGVLVTAAIFLFLIVLLRRKAAIEEEILGKPQKPWTIPVERVYLEHLRERDPRAHYVVRHFLMEEEHASALLWYKEFKQATRGARAKESLVVRHEHRYEKWRAAWKKKIAKPVKDADRYEKRLQRKLDRQAKASHRKQARKVRKVTNKMRKGYDAKLARETAKWEKAANRAAKKNRAAPPKPDLPEPDYPPVPALEAVLLAEHKWAAKAEKAKKRAARKQGDLEVKFERHDARRLRKVRRKVQKVARKLDDPDFVAEHPLLQAKPVES